MEENQASANKNSQQQGNTHVKPVPAPYRMKKLWLTATTRSGHVTQKQTNSVTETTFHSVLKQAKAMLAQHPQKVFEKNQKRDKSENSEVMHSFISPTFYMELDCNHNYDYRVDYAFCDCPGEYKIRKLLETYALHGRIREVILKPNYTTFFKAVLARHDAKYVYLLKV